MFSPLTIVGLESPDLHLTEALATELGLTAERLLGDHRVGAGRAGVNLVVHQVVELQDVHVAHRDRLGERLAGAAVEELGLARTIDKAHTIARLEGGVEQTDDLVLARTVEHRAGDTRAGCGLAGVLGDELCPVGLSVDLPAA